MKNALLLSPAVVFAGVVCWTASQQGARWAPAVLLSSFALALIALPVLSRRRLWLGFAAVALILVPLAVAIGSNLGNDDDSQTSVARLVATTSLKLPLTTFRLYAGRYPTTAEGLEALLHCPAGLEGKWRGPYLADARMPVDPWGRPYQYRCPGTHNRSAYDLWSLGPDEKSSADDIGNWSDASPAEPDAAPPAFH